MKSSYTKCFPTFGLLLFITFVMNLNAQSCALGTDKYCYSCYKDQCYGCSHAFTGADGNCVAATQTVENCEVYQSDGVCWSCVIEFYLDQETKKCVQTSMPGCFHEFQKGKCYYCHGVLTNSDYSCNSAVTCPQENCTSCMIGNYGQNQCIRCAKGFVNDFNTLLWKVECIPKTEFLANCAYSTDGYCNGCDYGYNYGCELGISFPVDARRLHHYLLS